ncbi:hypothetical protein OB919_16050 [Halobacteria archaeon AArc-curdl1]|uniref:Uncharacterized protein n=1 Tax=Natronosalvus hydrolyticus TaxID=2979988 RepID=A0AAP3E744_9EURY|nr:hypothetical protein [Halobacteria archaeon AArc-curdl1]
MHVDEDLPESFTEDEFNELYREVAEIDIESGEPEALEKVWAGWNTGSGRESQQYLDLMYCEPCDQYIDTPGEAEVHARNQHEYDPLLNTQLPQYIHGERSMSVGDIVQTNNEEYHMVVPIGFQEIEVTDEDGGVL